VDGANLGVRLRRELAISCQPLALPGQWSGLSIHRRWTTFPKSRRENGNVCPISKGNLHIVKAARDIVFRRVRCGFLIPVQVLYQVPSTRLQL
jgi:hypothetical protein